MKMNDVEALFKLNNSDLLNRWGDYGSVLCNGLNLSLKRNDPLRLGRTGPFVPPISFPLASDSVVITDRVKSQLVESQLSGIGKFHRVIPEKLVSIAWDQWDRTKKLSGDMLPYNGEPEEYILHNPHDRIVAAEIESLWSWHPVVAGRVIRSTDEIRLEGVINAKCDVFRLQDTWLTKIIVNQFGRAELSSIAGDWVTFTSTNFRILS